MHNFVICTENTDYEASLEPRKIYEVISDISSEKRGLLRVIDESGEDYLFYGSTERNSLLAEALSSCIYSYQLFPSYL